MFNVSLTLSNRPMIKDSIDDYETSCWLEIYQQGIVTTFTYGINEDLQLLNSTLLHSNIR
jgi:hypothetical protein